MKAISLFRSSVFLTIAFMIVLGMSVGCSRKPDNARLSSEIQGRFSQDSGLAGKRLTVTAEDGVVTLAGRVDNGAQRDAAGRQAASVAGVRTVVNNLVVPDLPVPPVTGEVAPAPATETPTPRATTASNAKPGAGSRSRTSHSSEASATAQPPAGDSEPSQIDGGSTPSPDAISTAPPPANSTVAQTPPPPPSAKKLIIDEGTQLTVRLIDPIDSEKNQTGDTFHATLNTALTSDGEQAVPAGVEVVGHLVDVKSAGKFAGQSVVALQLDSISSGGKTYNIQTDTYRKQGASRGKNTAEKVGGGAIIGGIIGAIAGGGKGAAIGTAAGAGVGGGAQAASKSQQIKLPSETVLNFVLQSPITVVQAPNPDADRQKLGDSR